MKEENNVPEEKESHNTIGNLMDSRTSHLDDALAERLAEAFHKITFNLHIPDVAQIAREYNPIDLAYAAPRLPPQGRAILFTNLPTLESKIEFVINTDSATRVALFRMLPDAEIAALIDKMPSDEAVWILDDLAERKYRKVLDLINPKKAHHIKELQQHSRNSAGGIMTNEFFVFHLDTTIKQAAAFIRNNPGIDMTRRIFIVDHQGVLQGYVPARNLIVNDPSLPLHNVMLTIEHQVYPDATREEVVDLVERYKISALPVVNSSNHLVGVITFEDVLEVIEDIADETIACMAGTAENLTENDYLFKRFLARAPWLIVTLCGGLVSATVMAYFQNMQQGLRMLMVSFVPLINAMSGNVGIQTSTVLVRSMGTGVLSAGKKGEAIFKESLLGLMTAFIFGTLSGIIVAGLHFFNIEGFIAADPLRIGVTVGFGLCGACMSATAFGVTYPFFFAKLGVDPALASGPIISACNDLFSIIIYFLIAQALDLFFFT